MLKMILADDEPIITRGIRKLVDWEQIGISVISEHEDGSSAMEQILVRKPDLALLDISMPGMTGIEILKNIHDLQLPTKVIFISGFQDFEYARDALTYGAVEYLLKPVIKEELLKAVEKAAGTINEQYASIRTKLEEREQAEACGVPEKTTYLPVLADVLFHGMESAQEKRLIRFSMNSFLEEYLEEKGLGILFSKEDRIVMILKGTDRKTAWEFLYELQKECSELLGKKTAFILGECTDKMSEIPDIYKKCAELYGYFFFEDQMTIPILKTGEPVFQKHAGMEDLILVRESILEAILTQDRESFRRSFERFARILCVAAEGRKEDACYYFCSMVRFVEDKICAMNLAGRKPDMKELLEKSRRCQNFSQMKSLFGEYLEGYQEQMKSEMENNDRKSIMRAKEYIETHYKENLTLEVLAGEVYMNPYYFSSFFKKHAGMNFKDYVNKVRIQQAVSLLVSTDMKAYEIASEVGFRDVRSFTEVFSRIYGETPNNYRKRILSGL